MTGRSAHMDAAQGALDRRGLPRSTRVACVLAGLLCAVGVLSAAALHANGTALHRVPHLATSSTIADGHGAGLRSEQHAVAASVDPLRHHVRFGRAASTHASSVATVAVDSVRTRGPPALA